MSKPATFAVLWTSDEGVPAHELVEGADVALARAEALRNGGADSVRLFREQRVQFTTYVKASLLDGDESPHAQDEAPPPRQAPAPVEEPVAPVEEHVASADEALEQAVTEAIAPVEEPSTPDAFEEGHAPAVASDAPMEAPPADRPIPPGAALLDVPARGGTATAAPAAPAEPAGGRRRFGR